MGTESTKFPTFLPVAVAQWCHVQLLVGGCLFDAVDAQHPTSAETCMQVSD